MPLPAAMLNDLAYGPVSSFLVKPPLRNEEIPATAVGIYTIFDERDGSERFLYVGIAGIASAGSNADARRGSRGLKQRLAAHASGRRSGDQFCIRVADRLVLPRLTREDIAAIAADADGSRLLDNRVGAHIKAHLSYRFHVVTDAKAVQVVREAEAAIRRGAEGWPRGKPHLNPL